MLSVRATRMAHRALCTSSTPVAPSAAYAQACALGELQRDERQMSTLQHLDQVHHSLIGYKPVGPVRTEADVRETQWRGVRYDKYGEPIISSSAAGFYANKNADAGLFAGLRSLKESMWGSSSEPLSHERGIEIPENTPKGAYIHGGVGCGKTMVMQIFFECAPVDPSKKAYTHFHRFMLQVHKMMEAARVQQPDIDPLAVVCEDLCLQTHLLCFDEFQVTDVADALLMKSLFQRLWAAGTVVVATSNREPRTLYHNGIQRQLFVPFITLLERQSLLVDMESTKDYRLAKLNDSSSAAVYLHPLSPQVDTEFDQLFLKLAKAQGSPEDVVKLELKIGDGGRVWQIERASAHTAVARMSFQELCEQARSAEDYIALASAFHTLFIEHVPLLDSEADKDAMRRLITCVDALYEAQVKVVVSAAAAPERLVTAGDAQGKQANHGDLLGTATFVVESEDELFAMARAVSRLREMQSRDYLLKAAKHSRAENTPVAELSGVRALSSADVEALWDRYDVDLSGELESDEVRAFMLDLTEHQEGHRQLTPEQLTAATEALLSRQTGKIDKYSFVKYFTGQQLRRLLGHHRVREDGKAVL